MGIYDADENLVRTLADNHFVNTGWASFTWDGKDEDQNVQDPGGYKVKLEATASTGREGEPAEITVYISAMAAIDTSAYEFNPAQGENFTISYWRSEEHTSELQSH